MCCNLVFLFLFFIISCLIIKCEQIKSKITEFWMSRRQNSSKFKDSPPNMAGVRFEVGGAYFNFRWQKRVLPPICKFFKKYG